MEKKPIQTGGKLWKVILQLLLIILLGILLFQNIQLIEVELFFWQVRVPLTILFIGTAVIGALFTFLIVWRKGR